MVVSMADVTEQRRLAAQLHDARRFETVASLAGSVAHDFNNLLTVSQMNADRLRKAALPSSRELERIRDVNKRAATLTRQLLVFSRRDVAHRQVFAPDTVIAKLEPLLRRTLDPRIELVVDIDADGRGCRDGSGAARAADHEPRVERRRRDDRRRARCASRVAGGKSTRRPGSRARQLRVDRRQRYRARHVRRCTRARIRAILHDAARQARGLGLAIVRSIARDAQARCSSTARPNRNRVEVLLPVTAPATQTASVTSGSERILLVEDDDGVREIARSTLEEAGYAVVAVRNGQKRSKRS